MAPGDACHGPRCSLTRLGPAALGYCPCRWPSGSAGLPPCARTMGCGLLFPVPQPPWARTCVCCPGPLGSCSPVCPLGALCCVWGVLGHLALVHRSPCSVRCLACAVSWATWLLFTAVPAGCVVLRVLCPGPLGSFSPVCSLVALCCVCGVVSHLAPVHRCAPRCVELRVQCSGPLGCCSPLCSFGCVVRRVLCPEALGSFSPVSSLGASCCVSGILGYLAPLHWCARSLCCVVCAVSWATWLLFTVCPLAALCWVCRVLGHLVPVHRSACPGRGVAWGVS